MRVICPTCGKDSELEDPTAASMKCPHCGNKIIFGEKSKI